MIHLQQLSKHETRLEDQLMQMYCISNTALTTPY